MKRNHRIFEDKLSPINFFCSNVQLNYPLLVLLHSLESFFFCKWLPLEGSSLFPLPLVVPFFLFVEYTPGFLKNKIEVHT